MPLDNNENLILDEEYYEPDLTLEEACEMLDCENWDFYTKSNESIQPRTRKFINKHFNEKSSFKIIETLYLLILL